jgi:hypothetical protein
VGLGDMAQWIQTHRCGVRDRQVIYKCCRYTHQQLTAVVSCHIALPTWQVLPQQTAAGRGGDIQTAWLHKFMLQAHMQHMMIGSTGCSLPATHDWLVSCRRLDTPFGHNSPAFSCYMRSSTPAAAATGVQAEPGRGQRSVGPGLYG